MEPDKKEPNFSELHNLSPAALEDKFSKHPLLLSRIVMNHRELEHQKKKLEDQNAYLSFRNAEIQRMLGDCEKWRCSRCDSKMLDCAVTRQEVNVLDDFDAPKDYERLAEEVLGQLSIAAESGRWGSQPLMIRLSKDPEKQAVNVGRANLSPNSCDGIAEAHYVLQRSLREAQSKLELAEVVSSTSSRILQLTSKVEQLEKLNQSLTDQLVAAKLKHQEEIASVSKVESILT